MAELLLLHSREASRPKTDFQIISPRTEYHCSAAEGHQGHVFDDGPKPTGQSATANNGVALKFVAGGGLVRLDPAPRASRPGRARSTFQQ
jgi:peptide methionine sulfoxide reductase MsrB